MGLDMYLYADVYVGGWDHAAPEEKARFDAILSALDLTDVVTDGSPHLEVQICVAYWRKANAIHQWFVKNVQDGKDECQKSYVEASKIQELADTCALVLADHSRADELLPTTSGFFFGGTEYDEWYWNGIEETEKVLRKILVSVADDHSLYYQSSW